MSKTLVQLDAPQTLGQLLKQKINQQTPQTQMSQNTPVLQVKNNAGGFVFQITPEKQLDRFLVIGSVGGTYYQKASELTSINVDQIKSLIKANGVYVVNRVVEISEAGRARNNDYALMVLALCFTNGSDETKAAARLALPKVARTGTHLMHFVEFANSQRGWGSSLKKAVANWYNTKSADDIAYQAVKYQSRDGWSQRDILRLSHPKAKDDLTQNTFRYITHGSAGLNKGDCVPAIIGAFEQAKTATGNNLIQLIEENHLSLEMIPTEARNMPEVWSALIPHMGATALVRNLNKMTALKMIAPFSNTTKFVVGRLTDAAWIKRSRIHPMQLLVAKKIYDSGAGDKGSLIWTPVHAVSDALERAFYLSFDSVTPTGKNRMLALDVSGSMNSACSGAPQISCREAASVLAMVTARVEPNSEIFGFDHEFRSLEISKEDSLATVLTKTYSRRFGGTDCSLPMLVAQKNGWKIDQFDVYTDNETYYGSIHPFEAMKQYRVAMKVPDAKLAVVSMTASRFSIADPSDGNMMDFVGFDTNTPAALAAFASGNM